MNLMMLLEMASSGFPDRVAVQNEAARLTYAELFSAAGGAAQRFRGSDCQHVALLDTSSLAVPVGLFGSAWAGIPYVPLNYRLTGTELDALLERIVPSYLVTDSERAPALADSGKAASVTERESFLSDCAACPVPESDWSMDAEDIAILLFTSGTTGAPKAAVLRHKHLVSYILGSVEFGGAAEEDAALVSVPPYHIAGMASVLSSVYSGRRIVQLPNFSAEAWIAAVRRENITHAFVVPTMLSRIVDLLESGDDATLPSLCALSYGGGKMPQSIIEKAMGMFPNNDFTNAYGLTETSSTVAVLGPDDHRNAADSDDPAVRRRLVSVGQPLPSIEVQIRNEEGKLVGTGESGEIYVRGEQVSGEYLGRESNVDAEGWFPTRDGGSMDSDGYLFVEGRIDDVIVRGGENLSPGEIEDTLLEHKSVADCAVVGIPSEQWGEAVAAAIVLRDGEQPGVEELQEWVKKHMRSSRVPECVEFWPELPYNETGKLLRRKVRQALSGSAS